MSPYNLWCVDSGHDDESCMLGPFKTEAEAIRARDGWERGGTVRRCRRLPVPPGLIEWLARRQDEQIDEAASEMNGWDPTEGTWGQWDDRLIQHKDSTREPCFETEFAALVAKHYEMTLYESEPTAQEHQSCAKGNDAQ